MNLTTHTSRRSFLRNGTKALTLPFLVESASLRKPPLENRLSPGGRDT